MQNYNYYYDGQVKIIKYFFMQLEPVVREHYVV